MLSFIDGIYVWTEFCETKRPTFIQIASVVVDGVNELTLVRRVVKRDVEGAAAAFPQNIGQLDKIWAIGEDHRAAARRICLCDAPCIHGCCFGVFCDGHFPAAFLILREIIMKNSTIFAR